MDLASHLGKSLQQIRRETTSWEFLIWKVYLDEEKEKLLTERTPVICYLANIAKEIRQAATPKSKTGRYVKWWKLQEFFLKLVLTPVKKSAADDQGKTEPTPEEITKKSNQSRSFWRSIAFAGRKKK